MAKAVLQSNIQASDGGLTVAAGATVTIRNSETAALATLYTTRAGAVTTANPTTADADGFFRVYIDPGRYDITATLAGDTQTFNDVITEDGIIPVVGGTSDISALKPYPEVSTIMCLGANTTFTNREFSAYIKYEISGTRQTGTAGLDPELGATVVYDADGNGWIRKFSDKALNPISVRLKTPPPPPQNQLELMGLDSSRGSLNRELSIGKTHNLIHYSEDITQSNYAKTGITAGSDSVEWNGITLTDITVNSFSDSLRTQLSTLAVSLNAGARYLVSYYSLALIPEDEVEFFWMRFLSNSGSFGHGARMHTRSVRRHWQLVEAVSGTTVDAINDVPTVEMGSAAGADLYWFSQGSSNNAEYKVFVGGFQIERIDGTPKQGVAVIGDSVTEGSSSEMDLPPSRQWTRYAEAALNVPFFNRATGGENTTQMNARWATDITPLAVNCSHAIIMASVNDFSGAGIGVAQIKTNINGMVAKAVTDGMIPVVGTVQARSPTYAGYEADRIEINDWIKSTFPRVIDADRVLSDMYETGILDRAWENTDYVHPSGYTGTSVASKALGFYVASLNFWDFIKPSAYQARKGAATAYPDAQGELFYDSIDERSINVAGGGSGVFEDLPESRAMAIRMIGTLTSNRTVYLYGVKPREWIINNQTSGAFTLSIGITDGSGTPLTATVIAVTAGTVKKIYTDGSELYEL